jgi:microcystin-dependent protein
MANTLTKILFRRGADTQRINLSTAPLYLGEPSYSIDTKRVYIGDGVTPSGIPVSIVNYGVLPALSGGFVNPNNSTQTNLTSAAFYTLSGANIGDIVYDLNTTSIYTVSSITTYGTIPNLTNYVSLSNLAHLNSTTNINPSQFSYNASQLTLQPNAVGISNLNANITTSSSTISGGGGVVLNIKSQSVGNNLLIPGPTNSVKITDNTGSLTDVRINQNQILGQTNSSRSALGPITLTTTGSTILSTNATALSINSPVITNYVPVSGSSLTGVLSALNANGGRLVTDITPVNTYDVVNLGYVTQFNTCTTPAYIASHFLALTGGTLASPGNLTVNGTVSLGSSITAAGRFTTTGSISALGNLSASRITSLGSPIIGTDVTNKAYVDSKFVSLSGSTLTGNLTASTQPINSTELITKGYVDSTISTNYIPLSGGVTITGALSSTNRIFVTSVPNVSAELTNKNYVDKQINNVTLSAVAAAPPGCIAFFATNTAPTGWIKANGAVLPIVPVYQNLFNVLPKASNGNTIWWQPGDGPGNFRLPDLRGQFIRGWADNGGVDAGRGIGTTQGDSFASHNHVITDPGHTHTVNDLGHQHGITDPGHIHSITDPKHSHTSNYRSDTYNGKNASDHATTWNGDSGALTTSSSTGITINSNTTGITINSNTTGITNKSSTTGITQTNTTGGTENRPTNIALLACIKY